MTVAKLRLLIENYMLTWTKQNGLDLLEEINNSHLEQPPHDMGGRRAIAQEEAGEPDRVLQLLRGEEVDPG